MKVFRIGVLLSVLLLVTLATARPHISSAGRGHRTPTPTPTPVGPSGPPAPVNLQPANGAQVTVPFAISWSAVTDPSGIIAYNWQVSPSSSFSPIIALDSTNGATQDTISGLANGTYFWRVQAVNGNFVQGPWSAAQSFSVTGTNSGAPGSPTLNPPHGATAFHPMEVIYFDWSAVPGAATYNFDASNDPSFPIGTMVHFDNIPDTTYSITLGDSMPQGTWYVRVSAVGADRVAGQPSNVVTFTLSFNAPLPPPPTPLSPADGATVTLPVTMTWTDVPNPQPSGYVLEIAGDPDFTDIQYVNNQITGPHWTVTSLPPGTKYWHVLSTQGDSAPGVPANTAWSATRSFVIPSTPPHVGALTVARDPASNGQLQTVSVQLTGPAPAGGAVVSLSSSDPVAAPAPSTFTIDSGFAFGQFSFNIGPVNTTKSVTLTATLNGASTSVSFVVQPSGLQSLTLSPSSITGGASPAAFVTLTGAAPAGGIQVALSSSNPALANVPATVTVAPGDFTTVVNVATGQVTANTVVVISASLNGTTLQAQLTLTPQQPPDSVTLDRTTAIGTEGASGTVRLASAATSDTYLFLSSSNPAVASVPDIVQVPQSAFAGGFLVNTSPVNTATTVTISVSGAGVTRSTTLTVMPSGVSTPTSTPTITATPTPTATTSDTVTITRAEYSSGSRELRIEATGTNSSAVLRVYVTSTNVLIGTLSNSGGGRYGGRFTWPSNPQNVTVRSSLGGSASSNVNAN